jgi:hypothetical protein
MKKEISKQSGVNSTGFVKLLFMKITALFIVIAIAITSLMSLGKSTETKSINVKSTKVEDTITKSVDSTLLTKELLVSYLLHKKIQHPEVAYAIIRQESNLSSNLFKTNNNLFGMRHPGVRPTKSLGRKNGFAHFESWQNSVEDYKLYLEFVQGHQMTREQYLSHLDRYYAHPGYSSHLKKHFDEYAQLTD